MRALVIAGVLAAGSAAHADPTDAPVKKKSPAMATLLSIGATVVPVATGLWIDNRSEAVAGSLVIGGAMIGPSIGHWYAGKVFTRGAAIRLLGAGMLGAAAVLARTVWADSDEFIDGRPLGLALGGAAVIVTGALVDWGTAGESAREHDVRVSPAVTAIKTPTGTQPALGLAGTF